MNSTDRRQLADARSNGRRVEHRPVTTGRRVVGVDVSLTEPTSHRQSADAATTVVASNTARQLANAGVGVPGPIAHR
ncbi:hypothetical protein ACWEQC_05950 [Streptomyces shenzhenensis]